MLCVCGISGSKQSNSMLFHLQGEQSSVRTQKLSRSCQPPAPCWALTTLPQATCGVRRTRAFLRCIPILGEEHPKETFFFGSPLTGCESTRAVLRERELQVRRRSGFSGLSRARTAALSVRIEQQMSCFCSR